MIRISLMATAAAGVFFYLAASYAFHHPESMLAQCILSSFHLGLDRNPFFRMGQTVGQTVYQVSRAEFTDSDQTTEEEEQPLCVPPDRSEAPKSVECQAISPEQRDFIIQTIKEQLFTPSEAVVPRVNGGTSFSALHCIPIPNDDEDLPKFMPPCEDDDDCSAILHGSAQKEAKNSHDPLFQFWLGLFESVAKDASDLKGVEEQEHSNYFHDEEPPQCLEDPAYQQQYPGCPFTGKCPGKEPASTPKMIGPLPSGKPHSYKQPSGAEMKPAGEADSMFHTFDPKKYELPARLRQLLPGDSTEAEEEPVHPEVDTMEFRPSDARPAEFDPKRM
jgi:hypothetical protein